MNAFFNQKTSHYRDTCLYRTYRYRYYIQRSAYFSTASTRLHLAYNNPTAGLILESPFASAFRVKIVYPIVPFDKFSSIDRVDKVKTPVFVTHSRDDPVITFWHGKALFEKAVEPKMSLWIESAGHSGITYTDKLWQKLVSFTEGLICQFRKTWLTHFRY